jgi:hypothetical protein
MISKMILWIRSKFMGNKKKKSGFDKDNPFLIL